MYKAMRSIYGRLIMIPGVGPMFRIPVLIWRAILGRQTGLGASRAPREDALAIAIAAIEGLRAETLALRQRQDEQVQTVASMEQGLRDRIEFARAEAMFELRAHLPGGGTPIIPGASATVGLEPRILDAAKVEAMSASGALRLNIGCGHVPLEGYVNVDMRELPGVDALAEAGATPFDPGTVTEVHSAHLLEHFPVEQLRRVVLPHWHALLRPGGELRAIVPDAEAMLADFASGAMSFDDLREVTYGLQEYEGDFHFNMFSREGLAALLRGAGFTNVSFAFQGRKNSKCRDMEIRGVRA
jgi:hypothetical protein